MNFVYICRNGRNEELRYSIRSLFENAPVSNIWVVGGKPTWYSGKYIPVIQGASKYENGKANLRAIMDSEQIPDSFVLMNDDFFVVSPISNIPTYHGGPLLDKVNRYKDFRASATYTKMLQGTYDILRENGVQRPLDYSIHVPMKMNKQNMEFAVSLGGAIRSVYGNMNRVGGQKLPVHDVKVHTKSIDFPESYKFMKNEFDLPFLSTSDATFPHVYRRKLREFSKRSPLERRV